MKEEGNSKRWLIGGFFVLGLILLLVLTFGTQRVSFFTEKTELVVYFPSVQGIREGDQVQVMGVRKGTVSSTTLVTPDQIPGDRDEYRARVTLKLTGSKKELQQQLSGTYQIFIRSSSVLGGSQISIERVSPDQKGGTPLQFDGPNFGESSPGGLQSVSSWFEKNKDSLSETVESIKNASASIQNIASRIEQGKGTVGQLISDQELYNQLKQIAKNTNEITSQIKAGKGVLGRLVQSEEMGKNVEATIADLKEASENINKISEKIRSGKGTLSKLVNDEQMAKNIARAVSDIKEASSSIRSISERIESGKGTVGKLIQNEKMGNDLEVILSEMKKASRSIREAAEKVNQGKGSLGKFINDDEFYADASKAVEGISDLTGSVQRIKTFVGVNTRMFSETDHSIHQAYVRVHPRENKFLKVGLSAFDLSHPETDFRFEDGVNQQDDQILLRPDAQLGAKFYDGNLTFRGGLIEGKLGAGTDYDLYVPFLNRSLKLSVEGRSPYDDVADEDLDEEVDGLLWRSSVEAPFLKYGRLTTGVSRIGNDEEFYVGLGFEYEDNDIRNFFSLLGLAN